MDDCEGSDEFDVLTGFGVLIGMSGWVMMPQVEEWNRVYVLYLYLAFMMISGVSEEFGRAGVQGYRCYCTGAVFSAGGIVIWVC